MAKRFTETNKWNDAWFMDLPNKYKLLWLFLLDNCNHAGIWEVNYKVAKFYIGENLEPSEIKRILKGRIIEFQDGKYWFIPKFIIFQYGENLSKKNKALTKVIEILEKYDLLKFIKNIKITQGASKGLERGFQAPKEKDKDKEEDKEKDKEEEKGGYGGKILSQKYCFEKVEPSDLSEVEKEERLLLIREELLNSYTWHDKIARICKITPEEVPKLVKEFVNVIDARSEYFDDLDEIKSHGVNWIKIEHGKHSNKTKKSTADKAEEFVNR